MHSHVPYLSDRVGVLDDPLNLTLIEDEQVEIAVARGAQLLKVMDGDGGKMLPAHN